MTSSACVLAIGGINIDTLAVCSQTSISCTSNPGRTTRTPGGVARNIAENLVRLGSSTRLVGAVGDDGFGAEILDPLAALGVDVSGVRRLPHGTGTYTAVVEHSGELVISVADMTATEALGADDLGALDADWIALDGNLLPAVIDAVLTQATCPVMLDPVGVAKAQRLADLNSLPVHTFTPNVAELAAFTGIDEEAAAVKHCHALGVEHVWLRDGARGSRLYAEGAEPIAIPVVPGPLVDVTGAGDSMLAGYIHALGTGMDVLEAAQYGAALAALTIASPYPVRPELTAALVTQTREDNQVR